MRNTVVSTLVCAMLGGVLSGCFRSSTDPVLGTPSTYRMKPTGLSAVYNKDSNWVHLTWTPPSAGATFYRVYRTTVKDVDGNLDPSIMTADGARSFIPGTAVEFYDIPALANAVYYYRVAAVSVDGEGNTVEGERSNIDSCQVGVEVSFAINQGDIFTATRECIVTVNDPARKVAAVRLASLTREAFVNGAKRLEVVFSDPGNPVSAATVDALRTGGFIDKKGELTDGTRHEIIPDFDTQDPEPVNAQNGSVAVTEQETSVGWVLPAGNGGGDQGNEKRVYAEITFNDGTPADTLFDFILIQPYRIKMNIRNRTGTIEETMRKSEDDAGTVEHVIYKPWVKFSTSIFADTTFDTTFHYWLVFRDSMAVMQTQGTDTNIAITQARNGWLQTKPRQAALTGFGAQHDDERVYGYSIDATTARGKENLSRFRRDILSARRFALNKKQTNHIAVALRGKMRYNESAVPGSYWGADPSIIKDGKLQKAQVLVTVDPADTSMPSSAAEMYQRLLWMFKTDKFQNGKKEFWIAAVFRGRFFGDTRTYLIKDEPFRAYMDLYPPRANMQEKDNPDWINNNHTIVSEFSYRLSETGGGASVQDDGRADIDSISLVIARMPEKFAFDTLVADTLSLNTLFSLRHRIFSHPIEVRSAGITGVKWLGIDPTNWPSGRYIFGIVTRDEFGNRGFAPISNNIRDPLAQKVTNPWFCHILTGK